MILLAILACLGALASAGIVLVDLDDCDAPPIVYTGSWTQIVNSVHNGSMSNYWNGTNSQTSTPGDKASLTFIGVQFTYWADTDTADAKISLMFDNVSTMLDTFNPVFAGQQTLFSVTNLLNKSHTFTITHMGQPGQFMNLDHLQYGYLAPDSNSSSPSPSSSSSDSKKSAPVGAIVGGVIGGILGLAALGFGIFAFVRSRKAARQKPNPFDTSPFGDPSVAPEKAPHPQMPIPLRVRTSTSVPTYAPVDNSELIDPFHVSSIPQTSTIRREKGSSSVRPGTSSSLGLSSEPLLSSHSGNTEILRDHSVLPAGAMRGVASPLPWNPNFPEKSSASHLLS
ncbi:hypothetical protein BOTBODRAFT_33158 [Botryobasidium botryosum FD-172 SS1]|uniref:Mid2 domain-containing protein n=1 Tax=Botryobasidium botryosum (strain FD-172 SS1) TaxID=930990 RepID=A0A067ME39_BOTB1|nr:hypothetical protein BOTBODRAFT_33158 [Botryobasidium botryosum FD-172 SS1]